ncbi:MAG: LON peptidase substrate-binding domain-containing protein [Hydrotalea sp.]|nr:LON peptidase substrate-binding domain-containing protein [Hydrotalea sp.]
MSAIPNILPVFPLSGVIIPPGAVFPLTVFESRYVAMLEDVLKNGRYLIMVQPKGDSLGHEKGEEVVSGGKGKFPSLYNVATLCKVVLFDENSPSRYRITAMGLQRLVPGKEKAMKRGYRRFTFQRKQYIRDLLNDNFRITDRKNFFTLLSRYLERFEKDVNYDDFEKLDDEKILFVVMTTFPFSPAEKQALLEAKNTHERFELLVALLEMDIKDQSNRVDSKKVGFWGGVKKRILQ